MSDHNWRPAPLHVPRSAVREHPNAFFTVRDSAGLFPDALLRAVLAAKFVEKPAPLQAPTGRYFEGDDVWLTIQSASGQDTVGIYVGILGTQTSAKIVASRGVRTIRAICAVYRTVRRRWRWQVSWEGEVYWGNAQLGISIRRPGFHKQFFNACISFGSFEKGPTVLLAALTGAYKTGPLGFETVLWFLGVGLFAWLFYSVSTAVGDVLRAKWELGSNWQKEEDDDRL